MPPDLNSLPASRTPSTPGSPLQQHPPRRISLTNADAPFRASPPSPRSPSLSSLQAAAAINASFHRNAPSNGSGVNTANRLERRRSSLMNNLLINDPAMPSPGETPYSLNSQDGSPRSGRGSFSLNTADPNHHRQPSLGELHQELENEQEAHVNRLLHMIRIQQDQLAAMQRSQEPTPTSPEASSLSNAQPGSEINDQSSPRSGSMSGLPHTHQSFNRPPSQSRQSSSRQSTNSRGTSPALRPVSGNLGPLTEDFLLGGTRDESAFYQAETQMLTRENQMLKQRIRELERQISELSTSSGATPNRPGSFHAHSPSPNSPLASAPATFTSGPAPTVPAPADAANKAD